MLFVKAWSENETLWGEVPILDIITMFLVMPSNGPAIKYIVVWRCMHFHFSGSLKLASGSTTHAPSMIRLLWFFVIGYWNNSTDNNLLITTSDLLKTFTVSNRLTTHSIPLEYSLPSLSLTASRTSFAKTSRQG